MFLLSNIDFLVFDEGGVMLGVVVGDWKLHELDDDVLQRLLALELVDQVLPAAPLAVSHVVQEFYVVLEAPTGLADLVVLRALHFLEDIHLRELPCHLWLAPAEAVETEMTLVFLQGRVPDDPADQPASRAVDPKSPRKVFVDDCDREIVSVHLFLALRRRGLGQFLDAALGALGELRHLVGG